MKKIVPLSLLAFVALFAFAQEPPKPTKEHEWLKQMVGEWTTAGEFVVDPAQPPVKNAGTDSTRSIGDLWIVSEAKGEMFGAPFTGLLTLGYDPEKKSFVGSWVDSVSTHMWHYTGQLDAAGKVLTLETEGPSPDEPGKIAKFRGTIEIKDANTRVFTEQSEVGGKWVTFMTITYTRKK